VVVTRLVALAFAFALLLHAGPVVAGRAPDSTPIDEIDWAQTPEYRIVPGDELGLNFGPDEQTPDRNIIQAVVVRPDGRITVYPIGDVVAAGRTPVEVQGTIVRLLAGELKQPRVVVEVTKMAGNQIHVLGRVKRPGSLPTVSLPTLMQALAGAGGFEDDAARGSVLIMHRVGIGSVNVERVRVDRMMRHGGDLPLSRFDIVYVPRTSIGNVNVFVDQFFNRIIPLGNFGLLGWELFHLDRVYHGNVGSVDTF